MAINPSALGNHGMDVDVQNTQNSTDIMNVIHEIIDEKTRQLNAKIDDARGNINLVQKDVEDIKSNMKRLRNLIQSQVSTLTNRQKLMNFHTAESIVEKLHEQQNRHDEFTAKLDNLDEKLKKSMIDQEGKNNEFTAEIQNLSNKFG